MTNAVIFNSLTRQLLLHLGGEDGTDLIWNAFNGKKKINVLRALALNDKTIPQIHASTGISESYLYYAIRKLSKLGLVEVKRTVPNRTPERGGSETNVWGLV